MGILQNIFNPDEYSRCYILHFAETRSYELQTPYGFKVKCEILCFIDKINYDEFKTAHMLDAGSFGRLLDSWYAEVFLPSFVKLGCSVRLLVGPHWYGPGLCRVTTNDGKVSMGHDPKGFELAAELKQVPFRRNGCKVAMASLDLSVDETLIEENYRMIKFEKVETLRRTAEWSEFQESIVAAFMGRELELEREFQKIQTNQSHKGRIIKVETRAVGRAVEFSWEFSRNSKGAPRLRGYRNDTGFTNDEAGSASHGICVIDAQSSGKAVQHLRGGQEYFYTFLLTEEEPLYESETFGQNLLMIFGCPRQMGVQTRICDSLRFCIRVPTDEEILKVEKSLQAQAKKPMDSNRERTQRALEELSSFVEFEEDITELQKQLVERIKSKQYPAAEEARKLERLKCLVAQLCVGEK